MPVWVYVAGFMLVFGSAVALIWWRIADTIGVSRDRRLRKDGPPPRPPGKVIRGFDTDKGPGE